MITKTIQWDEPVAEQRRPVYGRLLSLDALRGFEMFGSLVVGLYSSLLEAAAAFAIIWLVLYWMYRTKSFVKV